MLVGGTDPHLIGCEDCHDYSKGDIMQYLMLQSTIHFSMAVVPI